MSAFRSRALSGVPGRMRLFEAVGKEKNKIGRGRKKIEVQTQICIGKCCFEHSENEESRSRCKKNNLLDIKSNKGFLLCKD